MPLQIGPEVFKWLQGSGLVKEARRNQNNLMEISEGESARLMDGFVLGILFRLLLKGRADEQKLKKLDCLKENSTPAIRLYNWGILSQLLKQIGFNLEAADKSKITNYEPDPLSKVLTFLFNLKSKDPSQSQSQQKALKMDIVEIAKKSILDSQNTLEFLTISISKQFKISPQQTLNLYLDNNKYLSHLLSKGVKSSFQPVYRLLDQIKKEAQFLVSRLFCLDEQQNVNFIFNALRTCLISKDQQVVHKYAQFLIDVYDQYRIANINLQAMRNWVVNEGINTLFFCLKKHPTLASLVFTICYNYLDDQFFKHIQLSEKSILWNTESQRLLFFKNFIESAEIEILQKFSITDYFQQWNRLLVKTMKKTNEKQDMLLLTAIMEMEWGKLKDQFQNSQLSLPTHYINFLKNVFMAQNQLLFLQGARTLFSLMQILGSAKNPFAPLIYKILVNGFGSFSDLSKIVFMSENFMVSFKGITGLPGTALVQPLLNHLQRNKQWPVIELTGTLIEQKRVDEDASLDLIEMMTKIAFNDIRLGSIVLDVIFQSLGQLSQELVSGFLQDNTNFCLAQLYSLSKSINKSVKHLKKEIQTMKGSEENRRAVDAFVSAASKHILCKNMIGFIAKGIMIDQHLRQMLESAVFHTFIKIKVQLKKQEQAELLRPIMTSYYPEEDELEAKIAEYMIQAYPPKPPQESRVRGHSHNQLLSRSAVMCVQTTEDEEKTVILDPAQLKPSNLALKDLEKVRHRRYELQTIEVQRQRQKAEKQQKIQKFKTIQHEKRLVESMASLKNDVEYRHLQTIEANPSVQPETHLNKEIAQNLRLIDLQKQQQDPYREDAQSVLRRYKKVWRYLFFKYSIKKKETAGQDKVHMGQAMKMLKDYDFNFLRKDDVFSIVRLINQNLKRKNDIQYLNYEGFQDFVIQASILGYGKTTHPHLPPGKQLFMFVDQLKKITRQKSGSVQIFQNPEEAYFQETEVIRQYNKRLRENPDYILPEGYRRIKQTSLQYEYDFHPMLQSNIRSSYIDVLEVLDCIISKHPQLAFHIVEPLTIKSESYFAKPVLFQSLNIKMKEYSKGYLLPKKGSTTEKDILSMPSPPRRKQFKPFINFSLGIKLGIAETSLKDKSIAEQVAYCMEDILIAVQSQSTTVKKGYKRRITNDFTRRRRVEQSRVETERNKNEVNWKKRAESVKLQVELLRQKRKETDKNKKKKDFIQRKVKKQKEERFLKQKMTEFQRVKAKIAEKKEALLQLKGIEEQKVRQEKQEYKEGVQDYFKKMKEELHEKEQDIKKKKEEDKYKKAEEQQQKKQLKKRLYLSSLKKQQQILEKVDDIKQAYNDIWRSNQIQQVLTLNKKNLKLLFDLLLKYQKSKISSTNYDEIGLATLSFFCLKFQIIPFMLQKQDLSKILIYATKDDEEKKSNRKGINANKFQQVIFLIATKAKRMLNKMIGKRQKKEKKMLAFLNAQKSEGGKQFQAEDVEESSSSEQSSEQEKPTLQDEYLFNAEDVSKHTLSEVFSFLRLPSDKQQMDQRYKQALQVKTSKPRSLLIKQIRLSLQQP